MGIKIFCKQSNLIDKEGVPFWDLFITDEHYDTHSLSIASQIQPSSKEIETLWAEKRGDFREVNYSS